MTMGMNFTAVMNAAGEVFTFGNAKCLGNGTKKKSPQPEFLEAFASCPIAYLRAGHNHCVAFEQ